MYEEIKKSQFVRLLDVFVIGPGCIYLGVSKNLNSLETAFLILVGTGTIIYNGKNYLENKKNV